MDGDNFTYLGVASGLYRKPEEQQQPKQDQPKQTKQQQPPKQQQPKQPKQQQPKQQGGQKKGNPQKAPAENKENVDKNQEDVQIDPEEDVKEPEVEVDEVVDASNAGLFELCPDAILSKIAHLGGTQITCELALTCKYLKKKLFSSFLWKSVKSREYNTTKPIIKVKLEIPVKDEEVVDEEKSNSGLQSFPVAYFATESRLNSLLEFWLDKLRDAQGKQQKKGDLNVSFGGGIYIESAPANQQRGRQNESSQKVLAPKDLSTVAEWLEGAQTLLQSTSSSVTLPVNNGKATLSRFGRGGELLKLSFDNDKRTYYFSVSSFMLGLRQAGKDYLKLVGRCEVALPQWGKSLTLSKEDKEEEVEKFMEREKTIQAMLQHTKLNLLLKNLKNKLRSGALVGAKLDRFFADRKLDKKRFQAQKNLEYSSMHQFVLNNLPDDYEEIVKEAASQNVNAGELRSQRATDRDNKRKERIEAQQKLREEQEENRQKKEEQKQNQQQAYENRNQPKEKKRIVTVQTIDDEGFITNVKTKVVGKDKVVVSAKEEEKKIVAKQAKQAKKMKKVETQVLGSREQVSQAVLAANFWSVEPAAEQAVEEEAPKTTNKAPKQPAKKQQQQKQQAKAPAAQQPKGKQQAQAKQQPTQKQQPQKQQAQTKQQPTQQQQKQQPGKKQQGKKNQQQSKTPLANQDDNLIMGMPQNQVIAAGAVVVSVIAFMYTLTQGF